MENESLEKHEINDEDLEQATGGNLVDLLMILPCPKGGQHELAMNWGTGEIFCNKCHNSWQG